MNFRSWNIHEADAANNLWVFSFDQGKRWLIDTESYGVQWTWGEILAARTDGFKAMLKLKWLYKKKREIVRGFYMIYEWMMSTNYFILKVEYIELKINTK